MLNAIYETKFTHSLESTSITLIMPIIIHAMKSNSAEQKTKAARIIFYLPEIVQKIEDFSIYCDQLISLLLTNIKDIDNTVKLYASKTLLKIYQTFNNSYDKIFLPIE